MYDLSEKQLKQVHSARNKLGRTIKNVLCYDKQEDGSYNFAVKIKQVENGKTFITNDKFNFRFDQMPKLSTSAPAGGSKRPSNKE